MPAPTNTLLIEGSFSELADEFAQYIDTLRKEGSLQSEIAPLLEPIRQQEQSEDEADLKQRDEVLKKLVGAAAVLNGAPEKGELGLWRRLNDSGRFVAADQTNGKKMMAFEY
jgi:translation initiation factor 3 subunit M